jgi:hypothetical protein
VGVKDPNKDKGTKMQMVTSVYRRIYLTAPDIPVGHGLDLTITGGSFEEFGRGGDAVRKPVLRFRETDLRLVVNRTNAATLVALFGDDLDRWAGERISLVRVEVEYDNQPVEGIRVRGRALQPAPPCERHDATPPPDDDAIPY